MRSGRKSLLSSWIWLKWLKDFLARENTKSVPNSLEKEIKWFSHFLLSLSLSFSILRRELLLIYPMIIERSTSVQRHLWVLTSNPRPLGPWPWSQHPAGWPDQSWPQWCPPAIPYFHILSRLRGQNPFQPVWDNLGVSCFNFHKMQTKMDTDSQIVLSTGLIRFLAFPNQHLQISSISSTLFYTLRRKIWTYMRYVWISLNISLLFARGTRPPWWIWHLWRMVPSTTMEYPASGGVMSSALTAIHSESNNEGSKQFSLLHIKT